MKHPLSLRRAVLLATSCALLQHGGFALAAQGEEAAPIAGTRPAMNTLTPQPVADALRDAAMGVAAPSSAASFASASGAASSSAIPSAIPSASASASSPDTASEAQGNVAELMQMIQDAKLSELRTTYNGSYGASLFFYPREVTYYIALFQDKHFWRVIKSADAGRAEAIYAGFVQQTAQLSEVEIQRTLLQAQKSYIQDVIALSEERAKRLQADLEVARSQQAKVNDYQRQTQSEAAALREEKERAQAQLRQVQGQVMQLQRQTEMGLPGLR
uniref:Putative exported lipoprotein n=1 Tax=Burkholderia sp. (strain CCGE1003) TaxID=640512 RepID=E1T6C5_BURSG